MTKETRKYRKIPKISPGAYVFQRPFLRGLFLETFLVRLNGLLVVDSEPSPVSSLMNILSYNSC